MPAVAKIGNWTTSNLAAFVQNMIRSTPSEFGAVTASELKVKSLTVEGSVDQPMDVLHRFGAPNEPAFANSWVADGTHRVPAYWKDNEGVVHLQGWISTGTVDSAMAAPLPLGYRPTGLVEVAVLSNGALGIVKIGSDGVITPATPSSNVSVSLDGISFRTTD